MPMQDKPIAKSEVVRAENGSSRFKKKIPNILTFLRILVVPVFVYLLVEPTPGEKVAATIIFVVASFTDWLDGYLARLYKAESPVGKLLDPLADKILVMAALVMLAAVPSEARVPAWMVVVLLGREMVVNGFRMVASVSGTVVPASRWAKHKTAWTMLALVFLLIDEPYKVFGVLVDFHFSGMVFLSLALIYSVTTGFAYTQSLKNLWVDE